MSIPKIVLTKGAMWTVGAYGIRQLISFSTNLILTRLLAPELFGIMVIVNSLRTGIELISDIGVGKSIVQNKHGDEPDFRNTAWTLQILRSLILALVFAAAAVPVAQFYRIPELAYVMPVAAIVTVIAGFRASSIFLLQKRMRTARLNAFDLATTFAWAVAQVALSYFYPTIWSLVIGLIVGAAITTIASYFVLPGIEHRIRISRSYVWQIFHFGKWIFLASAVYFLSTNFDRLYLAGAIPLALLGVYGIARSISDLVSTLFLRLGDVVVFPFVAARFQTPRDELWRELAPLRLRFLLLAAVGFAGFAATADIVIRLLFDPRYHEATWMVAILVLGAWVSILSSLNEATLLGFGKSHYGAIAYGSKFAWLLIALPLGIANAGVVGGIFAVAAADLFRYLPVCVGQIRERFSFWRQDIGITVLMLASFAFFEGLRWTLGFGTSIGNNPIFR